MWQRRYLFPPPNIKEPSRGPVRPRGNVTQKDTRPPWALFPTSGDFLTEQKQRSETLFHHSRRMSGLPLLVPHSKEVPSATAYFKAEELSWLEECISLLNKNTTGEWMNPAFPSDLHSLCSQRLRHLCLRNDKHLVRNLGVKWCPERLNSSPKATPRLQNRAPKET